MLQIINYFSSLLRRIQPLQTEVVKARGHGAQIRSRLAKSFNLVNFTAIGSHQRGTAIRHYSDVDYFAIVSRKDLRWGDRYKSSDTFLKNVTGVLLERFPLTDISRSGQAVVVRFEGGEFAVDVVPSIFWEFRPFSTPIYLIPDGRGGYVETSPPRQHSYIKVQDEKTGFKLKRTLRLLKFWKANRTPAIPLRSFYLELLLASSGLFAGQKSIARCVYESFRLLRNRNLRALIDPLKISGYVNPTNSDGQTATVVGAIDYAYRHSLNAIEAEEIDNDVDEAQRQWDIVFNR